MEFEEIYKKYLKKINIEKPVKLEDFEKVFLLARKDFFDYKISVDQFSAICEALFVPAGQDSDYLTSHLATALESAMELSWYVRQRPKDDAQQLNYFLQYIHDYKKEF